MLWFRQDHGASLLEIGETMSIGLKNGMLVMAMNLTNAMKLTRTAIQKL